MRRTAACLGTALAVGCPTPSGPPEGPTTAAAAIDWQATDRTVLPIPEPERPLYTQLDARDVQPPPRFEVKAPEKAPNVVIILVDDLGFGATEPFGGPITTPTLDALADTGLRFNNFHTTALCSPTRVALKSGRNHHTGEAGSIMESATAFPGNTGRVPNSVAPLAEMLRLNGYSTAAFGKWHETPAWESNPSGPYDRWPHRQGFDKFYGFIGGETNQWAPLIYDGTHLVELPDDPDYHFMTDMTDQAVEWIDFQQTMTPDKPFFVYFAPGATHAPHHVPQEWIDRWDGKFDQGWDTLREESLARQIAAGVVPEGTTLPPKPEQIKDWDALTDDEKRLFTKQAEVFAAFVEMTDHEIGRMIQAIDDRGELDNTLVFYVVGDNGTSAEGGAIGTYNEMSYFNGVPENVPDLLKVMDKWGSDETYPHMAAGWAVALDTPFAWTKQMASDYGGTRNGLVVHWPDGIAAKGEIRSQFHHVIDVAPTVLEAAGLPEPKVVNGTVQTPIEGTSMLYAFADASAPDRHVTQYFEMFGNRAIYHDGWLARTHHKDPWRREPAHPLAEDVWQLYDVRSDFSLANDLAAAQPEKLAEMQALFMEEASKYHALPLDDRLFERFDAAKVGRPDIMQGRTSLTLGEGMMGITENVFINVKNRSVTITAEVEVPQGGGNGAILVQGGRFGGWALYVKDGKPAYDYNFLGMQSTTIGSPQALSPGKHTIRLEFAYDGGGPGKGGNATLHVDDAVVAEGRIEHTQAVIFSADESADVGIDLGTAVVASVGAESRSRFTGRIASVTVAVQ